MYIFYSQPFSLHAFLPTYTVAESLWLHKYIFGQRKSHFLEVSTVCYTVYVYIVTVSFRELFTKMFQTFASSLQFHYKQVCKQSLWLAIVKRRAASQKLCLPIGLWISLWTSTFPMNLQTTFQRKFVWKVNWNWM